MTSQCMRNYDVGKQRRNIDSAAAPSDISLLPLFSEPGPTTPAAREGAPDEQEPSSDESDAHLGDTVGHEGAGRAADEGSERTTPLEGRRKKSTVSLVCGVLPDGTGLHDFHVPPRVIHARNQENIYWQDFETKMTSV